jgi:hypothetical protein
MIKENEPGRDGIKWLGEPPSAADLERFLTEISTPKVLICLEEMLTNSPARIGGLPPNFLSKPLRALREMGNVS